MALLAVLLASEPARRGIVFDQPHVVPAASQLLANRGLADRIDVVAGNFFDAVPSADIYVMSAILHDWDDAAAARLLTNMDRIVETPTPFCFLEATLTGAEPTG